MRPHPVCAAAALALSIAAPGAALAQGNPAALTRHAARPEERAAVLDAARAQSQSGSCRDVQLSIVEPPIPFQAQRFEGDRLIEGSWLQGIRAEGCGAVGRLSIWSIATPGQPTRRVGLLPGRSLADPLLQRDGVRYATIASMAAARDCEAGQRRIVDTRFEGPPSKAQPGQERAPWTEIWQVQACGAAVMIRMRFDPNDSGTLIRPELATPR